MSRPSSKGRKLQAPSSKLQKPTQQEIKRFVLASRIARLIFGDARQLVLRKEITNETGWGEQPVADLIERELRAFTLFHNSTPRPTGKFAVKKSKGGAR